MFTIIEVLLRLDTGVLIHYALVQLRLESKQVREICIH